MPWDADKSTAADPDNPAPDEQLTADEWDAHVTEGHFPSDELNFGVDAGGDPVITDPQNGGETVMRYDRATGSWVIDSVNTEQATIRTISGLGVNADWHGFTDLQEAVNFAASEGLYQVFLGANQYGSVTISDPTTLTGTNQESTEITGSVDIQNSRATVANIQISGGLTAASGIFAPRVESCWLSSVDVSWAAERGHIIECYAGGSTVTLTSDSADNVVQENTFLKEQVTDNGTGNDVDNNTIS